MGINYNHPKQELPFGKNRFNQQIHSSTKPNLNGNFDEKTLHYLDEPIIDHLIDSLLLNSSFTGGVLFNDYSFLTAPAYKALEGFLFQLARDLKLKGDEKKVGTYFDPVQIDKAIDSIIAELGKTVEKKKISKDLKQDFNDRITEMRRFLVTYRHTPAHFKGKRLDTREKANQNTLSIYKIINDTAVILLENQII